MKREWKPGDVALAYDDTRLIRVRPIEGIEGNDCWLDEYGDRRDLHSTQVRPLVVIDPEDREQIERLADVFCAAPSSGWVDNMQAAFRRLVEPPKPEEPTGPLTNNELAAVRRLLAERDS